MTERIGLAFGGETHARQMVEFARRAEARGFEAVWVAETRLTRDGVAPCAAIAACTSRIKVGTGILNAYTRSAVLLAVTFASLDELAGGRLLMGLGAGSALILAQQGVRYHRPLTRLRETIEVLRPLLRGERVTFTGETIRIAGAQLEAPASRRIPLYLGVTGPRALELAGEIADGVLLNDFMPAAYVERALAHLEAGARRSGRRLADIDVAAGLATSVDGDGRRARDLMRPQVALYLSLFPDIAQQTGLPSELIVEVRAAFHSQGLEAASAWIDDGVLAELTAAGNPAECREKIAAYRALGVQMPVLSALAPGLALAIDTLGPVPPAAPNG